MLKFQSEIQVRLSAFIASEGQPTSPDLRRLDPRRHLLASRPTRPELMPSQSFIYHRLTRSIQEISDRATAKHRLGEASAATATTAAAPGGSFSSASSASKAGHKKTPSTEGRPGPASKVGAKTRSPVIGTAALPGSTGATSSTTAATAMTAGSSSSTAAQSTPSSMTIASRLPSSLLSLLYPSSTEPWSDTARSALFDALEQALRKSPAHEMLVILGRRATLGGWYRAEKGGVRPGATAADSSSAGSSGADGEVEAVEWEGEALPEGAELATLEGRLREAMAELGGEVRILFASPSFRLSSRELIRPLACLSPFSSQLCSVQTVPLLPQRPSFACLHLRSSTCPSCASPSSATSTPVSQRRSAYLPAEASMTAGAGHASASSGTSTSSRAAGRVASGWRSSGLMRRASRSSEVERQRRRRRQTGRRRW